MNQKISFHLSVLALALLFTFSILSCKEEVKKKKSNCFSIEKIQESLFADIEEEKNIVQSCFYYKNSSPQQIKGFESNFTANNYVNFNNPTYEQLQNLIIVSFVKSEVDANLGKILSIVFTNEKSFSKQKSDVLSAYEWTENTGSNGQYLSTSINGIEYILQFKNYNSKGSTKYFLIMSPKSILEVSGEL